MEGLKSHNSNTWETKNTIKRKKKKENTRTKTLKANKKNTTCLSFCRLHLNQPEKSLHCHWIFVRFHFSFLLNKNCDEQWRRSWETQRGGTRWHVGTLSLQTSSFLRFFSPQGLSLSLSLTLNLYLNLILTCDYGDRSKRRLNWSWDCWKLLKFILQ